MLHPRADFPADCDDLRCLTALIVGGSSEARSELAELLGTCGFDCVDAADGIEALRFASDLGVDIVIAAAEMPRLNGEELLGLINRGVFGSSPPPTLLWSESHSNGQPIDNPAIASISMRCDIDELSAALARVLPVD